MPYADYLIGGRRWVKIRDQWWDEFRVVLVVLAICGPFTYFKLIGVEQIAGLLDWSIYVVTWFIPLFMVFVTFKSLWRAIRRRHEVLRRSRRQNSGASRV